MLMELRQLEYLVAVAEEANFTRAAERIHVAQPAVSAQIQRLERELGQQLLDRSRRTVRLTAAGEAVLPYARAALAAVDDMHVAVEELTDLVRGAVTIGTVTSHSVDIPQLLADFHADHPNVEITLSTDSSDNLIENVRTGQLDAAIVSVGPDECPDGLEVQVVTDEAIQAACAGPIHLPSGPRSGCPTWATGRSSRCPSARASAISSTRPARRRASPRGSRSRPAPRRRWLTSQSADSAWRSCPRRCRGAATTLHALVFVAGDPGAPGAGVAVVRPGQPGGARSDR